MGNVLTNDESKLLNLFSLFYDEKYEEKLNENNNRETGYENLAIHIMMQKMCYFLKVFLGEYADMSFTWNTRGPYSYSIQQKLLKLDKKLKESVQETSSELAKSSEELVLEVKNSLEIDTDNLPCNKAKWVELVASLDYISRFELPRSDSEKIQSLLKERKPYFDRDAINAGWNIVEKCKKNYP